MAVVKEEYKFETKEIVNKIHPKTVQIEVSKEGVVEEGTTTIGEKSIKAMLNAMYVEESDIIHESVNLKLILKRNLIEYKEEEGDALLLS
ncbi:UNVERIFIED_CONTAM: hypothetical protein Slati_2142800 [Sesamum latifolium]|uniref:Uncharacterized protein n=1 Tax=Sesamum latifolium TaxID=2727402 RepID=A0AAW2WSF7_9LAMI